ncbi:PREDICTED: solute carrier family 41 member 1-like isoform X1 [Polistes dominula]|uniref:Solute carrier family 41 member 1-like isoform X1 n=2 Tax=Polistes dominula TaxID=743375 RepID=A0ABM1J3E5_POLDO|nr:PREDICTED: solute carrier family 41 member 1-like isoform X1 [Polistes dominula]XP_015186978.1 PREDICTED: solute carrier family 41 member 1-like isoform X1 [Polistes dominula]XP_015186979.1 PREDICTED: solute carrier family 41 member 1-like isoform X1 [Polistes dominula]XP_015186980.1 PREDICTED: solute carrier family 41 member 1-like isoform X1 [Polistes dominula]XP_015186982.1 PREDICTED: solute carrier family 41 member 1-like isoform X1 [Polistes dominula]
MIEGQVHQLPVRLPPDKNQPATQTPEHNINNFENELCTSPLLQGRPNSHRMSPTDGRSRSTSESNASVGTNTNTTIPVNNNNNNNNNNNTTNNVASGVNGNGNNNSSSSNSSSNNGGPNMTNNLVTVNSNGHDDECVEVTIFDENYDNNRLPDVVAESKIYGVTDDDEEPTESYCAITIQVFIPFLIAGLGMVGAGLVLDLVQHWVVFDRVNELMILVPALLGLKGNLEMTLASRLSTQANLGHMDTPKQQWYMIVGNLVLIQCQAIVVGFLGSVVAIVMGAFRNGTVSLDHAYLLCASSLVTASLASFVLGLITAGVIVFSRHCHINPDNVATPIAASLGDITSLALLSWISTILYESIDKQDWLAPLVIACYVLVTPLWVWIAKRNKYTNDVLYSGWTPVMVAMLISSCGGLILEFMVSRFENLTVFQPVINGVGGNLVAVQASRISTALHKQAELGTLLIPTGQTHPVIFITPIANFFGKGIHARTTRVLMSMVIPGHIIFIYLINYMKDGNTSLTPLFVFVYLCAAVLQVAALLYIAYIMIHWMWKRKIDPDNSAIPYLTAMGDLLGISLLAIAFQFLYLVGDQDYGDQIKP